MTTRHSRMALRFRAIDGALIRITIPRPNITMTPDQAKEGMEKLIDSAIVLTNNGKPHTIHSAKIYHTDRTRLIDNR